MTKRNQGSSGRTSRPKGGPKTYKSGPKRKPRKRTTPARTASVAAPLPSTPTGSNSSLVVSGAATSTVNHQHQKRKEREHWIAAGLVLLIVVVVLVVTLVQNRNASNASQTNGQGGQAVVVTKQKKEDERSFASKALIVVLYALSLGLFLTSALAWRKVVPFLVPYSAIGKDMLPFASLFMFAMTITMTVAGFATGAIIGYIFSAMSALYYFFPFDRADRARTHVGETIPTGLNIEKKMVEAMTQTDDSTSSAQEQRNPNDHRPVT